MNELAEDLVLFFSSIYDLPSDSYCTILQGVRKNIPRPDLKSSKYNYTIGDDLRIAAQELCQSNYTYQSQSSSVIHNFDDSYVELKSIRKSANLNTVISKLKKPWHVHIFLLIFCFITMCFLQDNVYKRTCSYVVILGFIWLNYHFISSSVLQLYFLISTFLMLPSDVSVSKKQILKRLLNKTSLLALSLWQSSFIFMFLNLGGIKKPFELFVTLTNLTILYFSLFWLVNLLSSNWVFLTSLTFMYITLFWSFYLTWNVLTEIPWDGIGTNNLAMTSHTLT